MIHDVSDLFSFKPGEILIADTTTPDWEPIMKTATAIVTNKGGRTCHAAIVSRELGVPAVTRLIIRNTGFRKAILSFGISSIFKSLSSTLDYFY